MDVSISKSIHQPPPHYLVEDYMNELYSFINSENDEEKYHLIKIAQAHHRFAWIHPFQDGNGRTVRALTYAMLIKYGFQVDLAGRLLNPTAIFCSNRALYYRALSWADTNEKEKMLAWCEYVFKGLSHEIEKVDKLLDYDYLSSNILMKSYMMRKSEK
ncbi:Fic family protein [Lentisphaerota bacterium WC36G]|nr:Fic family protein [Lentisphaerae bacterium WC36]